MQELYGSLCVPLCCLGVFVLVIVAIIILVRRNQGKTKQKAPKRSPLGQLAPSFEQVAKYTRFWYMTRYSRTGRSFGSIQGYARWAASWMAPEWRVHMKLDEHQEPSMTIEMQQGSTYRQVYNGDLVQFERELPAAEVGRKLSDSAKARLMERVREMGETIEVQEDDAAHFAFVDRDQLDDEAIEAYLNDFFDRALVHAEGAPLEDQDITEVRLLAKYLVFAKHVELAYSGRIDVSVWEMIDTIAYSWLMPDYFAQICRDEAGGLLLTDENGAVVKGYVDCFSENVPFGAKLAKLDASLREQVGDLARDLGIELASLLERGLGAERAKRLREVFSKEGVTSVLTSPVPAARGIRFIDMGVATEWQAVLLCKGVLCTLLSNKLLSGEISIEGIERDNRSIARWSAQWLPPHWELVIVRDKMELGLVGDSIVELYPIVQATGERDKLYFQGSYADLVYHAKPIIHDADQLDKNRAIGVTAANLLHSYGRVTDYDINPDTDRVGSTLAVVGMGASAQGRAAYNDAVILASLKKTEEIGVQFWWSK
jgi:hypothetical protein